MLSLYQIISLSVAILLGTPIYFFFRDRMSENDGRNKFYLFRILKVLFLIFLLNFIVILFFLYCFFSLNGGLNFYLLSFLFLCFVIFFGNGVYAASIVLKSYDLNFRKNTKHGLAQRFLHGPIAHVLIYQSYYLFLLILGIVESSDGENYTNYFNFVLVAVILSGVILGLTFFGMHYYNYTLKFQLYSCSIIFLFANVFVLFCGVPFSLWLYLFYITSLIFIPLALFFVYSSRFKQHLLDRDY